MHGLHFELHSHGELSNILLCPLLYIIQCEGVKEQTSERLRQTKAWTTNIVRNREFWENRVSGNFEGV